MKLTNLDKIWAKEVKDRDKVCQVCRNKNPQSHHIIPRGYKLLRHNVKNGIGLCYYHHKGRFQSAHQNALWFSEWLKIHKPEVYEYLWKNL